jgi:hypothetical protein
VQKISKKFIQFGSLECEWILDERSVQSSSDAAVPTTNYLQHKNSYKFQLVEEHQDVGGLNVILLSSVQRGGLGRAKTAFQQF